MPAAPETRLPETGAAEPVPPLTAMLEARSVALVGASPRPGSLGARMIAEVGQEPGAAARPTWSTRGTPRSAARAAYPSLADLPGTGGPGPAGGARCRPGGAAGGGGARARAAFGRHLRQRACDPPGPLPGLRDRLAATARAAGMAGVRRAGAWGS